MEISKQKWNEAKAIVAKLEGEIEYARKAGIALGYRELLSTRQLNQLLDECMEEFEAELCAQYNEAMNEVPDMHYDPDYTPSYENCRFGGSDD